MTKPTVLPKRRRSTKRPYLVSAVTPILNATLVLRGRLAIQKYRHSPFIVPIRHVYEADVANVRHCLALLRAVVCQDHSLLRFAKPETFSTVVPPAAYFDDSAIVEAEMLVPCRPDFQGKKPGHTAELHILTHSQ